MPTVKRRCGQIYKETQLDDLKDIGSGNDDPERLRREARFMEDEARRLQDEERRLQDEAHRLEDQVEAIEAREHHDRGHDHDHGRPVEFTIVVNGQPATFEASPDEPMRAVRDKALQQTGNVGRPAEDWELKDEAGNALDLDRLVRDFCFGEKVTLFLSLRAGVAGA